MSRSIALLRQYLSPHRRKATALAVLVLLNAGLSVAIPLMLGRFVDTAQTGGEVRALLVIAGTFIGLTLVNQVIVSTAAYHSEDLGWLATNRMRADLVGHTLKLDQAFHKQHTPGELIERVDGDVTTLAQFFSSFVFHVLGNSLLAIGIVFASFFLDWRIGMVLLVFGVAAVLVLRRTQHVAVPYFTALRQTNADLSGFLEERLAATEDIRGNGTRDHVVGRLTGLLDELTRTMRRAGVASRASSSALELSVALATVGILALGAVLLGAGAMTLGALYVGYHYAGLLSMTLFKISYRIDQLQLAVASVGRIAEIHDRASAVVDGPGADLPPGPLSVRYRDVSFAYPEGKPALSGVSFELAPGETMGLLGRTGSGKTTIGRLLYRGYDADRGEIQLGGVDVRELTLEQLRSRVAVVTQDVRLFEASVRDNLTLFDDTVPDDRIVAAIGEVGLDGWLDALPDGLDTPIGEGGNALSAGEAQLLAFARVFLREPDLVILDEASSRLDPATERLTASAQRRLLAGRTAIVIAHHLATVRSLDHIVVLDDGRIVESGRREQLTGDPESRYSALLAGVGV